MTNNIFSLIDLELYYTSRGYLSLLSRPMPWGMNCSYTWESANGTYSDFQVGQIKTVLGHTSTVTRFLISCLTALTLILVWWYSELERRLLVVKHHLCREMNLLCSPLAAQFILEGSDLFKFQKNQKLSPSLIIDRW